MTSTHSAPLLVYPAVHSIIVPQTWLTQLTGHAPAFGPHAFSAKANRCSSLVIMKTPILGFLALPWSLVASQLQEHLPALCFGIILQGSSSRIWVPMASHMEELQLGAWL